MLEELGLAEEIPVAALAKRFEEIYVPGEADAIRLPRQAEALYLLQRIRDEAHRWANGYHQLLMKRRVEESVLDDIPGISENRKAALLKEFGSVARLRKQTPEALAAISGISRRLAGAVLEWLETH